MSARRDLVRKLLQDGHSHLQVAALTNESPAYVARVDRVQRRKDVATIIKTIGRERGAVEIFLVPGEAGKIDGLLIAPADRDSMLDTLIECLTKPSASPHPDRG